MGSRGPQPVPTATLERRGSWLAKTRTGEPEPTKGDPGCPEWVSDLARPYWGPIALQLEAMGVLGHPDGLALGMLCDALALYLAARNECKSLTAPTETGSVISPEVKIQFMAWDRVMKACREFGLTPASRTGVRALAGKDGKPEGKGRFFGGPKLVEHSPDA